MKHPIQVMRGPVTVTALPRVQIVSPIGKVTTNAIYITSDGGIRSPTQQEVFDDLARRGIQT